VLAWNTHEQVKFDLMKTCTNFFISVAVLFTCNLSAQTFRWAQSATSPGNEYTRHSISDSLGFTWVAGVFEDTLTFTGGPGDTTFFSAGMTDIFLALYAPNGMLVATRQLGGKGEDFVNRLYRDTGGNLVMCGYFKGTSDFDPSSDTLNLHSGADQHGFVIKIDPAGTLLWAKSFVGKDVNIEDVSGDASGYYFTGEFFNSIDLDPGPASDTRNTMGWLDVMIFKLDAQGGKVWGATIGGTQTDFGRAITANGGAVYLSGNWQGLIDFDSGPGGEQWYSTGQTDMFILKLDGNDGSYLEHGRVGGSGSNYAVTIDMLALDGAVWLTGVYAGSLDFDPQEAGQVIRTWEGGEDMFLLRVSSEIEYQHFGSVNGEANEVGRALETGPDGHLYVIGSFDYITDIDPGEYERMRTPAGNSDLYILELQPTGEYICDIIVGGPGYDGGSGIGIDKQRNIYVSGVYAGSYTGNTDFDPGSGTANLMSSSQAYDSFVASYQACALSSGLAQHAATPALVVFPNPASDVVHFPGVDLPATVYVYDNTGALVIQRLQNDERVIDLEGMPAGIYLIQCVSSQLTQTARVVKE
jgi:hypothetical protein